MKIIRLGVLNTEVLCGTCDRCGCEVEVTQEECSTSIIDQIKPPPGMMVNPEWIKAPVRSYGDTLPQEDSIRIVNCPTPFCGEQIRIYAK
jgi:hypothetical protein